MSMFVRKNLMRLFALVPAAFLAIYLIGVGQAQERVLPETQTEIQLSFAPLVRQVIPAVVNVYASRRVQQQQRTSPFRNDPFFRRFFDGQGFGVPQSRVQSALGSGVIISPTGIIVTNHHVIEGATDIKIVLSDKREFAAEVILKDELTDLAVLRVVDADETFPALELGDSDAVEVGDLVLAVGNPFGVGQTVTSGIISALARTRVGISDHQFFIQTDAAINPGNSGGALVDMSGKLVGINTAIFSRSGGSNGIGFAIPVNMARVVIESAQAGGIVLRPWLGAEMQAVSAEIAESLGMSRPIGVMVTELSNQGPARSGGLEVGDVILSVDGVEIEGPQALNYRLATRGVGGTTGFIVLRNGREVPVSVALITPPEIPLRNETLVDGRNPISGATVANLSPALASEMRRGFNETGVIVMQVAPRTRAQNLRLQRGDIIREVNGFEIRSVADLLDELDMFARRWALAVEREGRIIRVVVGR
ncbi:MAG: DegQ family serine endoprotease [Rhizobiales bacterium]|nr:DegQ family serine endoprotease [Hyphomicrobiales bacterium]